MPQDSPVFPKNPGVVAPPEVKYLELTRCSAKWNDSDHTSVDLTAEGYIRSPYRAVRLTPRGWQNIQADGDSAPRPSLVIYVEEIASSYPGTVPRGFYTLDNFIAPPELSSPSNITPEVVFCGLEPGVDISSPPSGQMRRMRLRI